MFFDLKNKSRVLLWQALFLILGTSWLWTSRLNPHLSYRSSLISQYETAHQPYSWLFRLCDVAAGLLLAFAAAYFLKRAKNKTAGLLLAILSAGLLLDPLLTTTCRTVGNVCAEYFSWNFVLHAAETILTAAVFFVAGIYDSYKRRKVVSIAFVGFQLLYGGLFLTQWADQERFNTASQLIYQTILIAWLAWYVRDYWRPGNEEPQWELPGVKPLVAGWAYLNGVLAILISLSHLNLLGRIRGVYFSSDTAWLAQHGMVIGVLMLYLARHLARGERRARQIFLFITGIEVIKYSVISPSASLLAFYQLTFIGLFLAKDSFDRGSVDMTRRLRLKDLIFLLAGLLTAVFAALLALDRDNRASVIAARSIDNFSDYAANHPVPKNHLTSVLLAHSISVFAAASLMAVLWVLFRPNRQGRAPRDYVRIEESLRKYSNFSEDYFKLWPRDKDYYRGRLSAGFVAYKIVGSTAFALADPIGPDRAALLNEFSQWCRARRLKMCFFPVYGASEQLYKNAGLELVHFGSSAEINIADFAANTVNDKWWRWKQNQAKKAGYIYAKSTPPHSSRLMSELRSISDQWLKVGGHRERGFALGYFENNYLQKCLIYYLKDKHGDTAAFANELPQFHPSSIRTVDLLRYSPDAANAMPFLLASIIKDYADNESQVKIFDLGFVPFAKAKGPLMAVARAFSTDKFSSQGLEQFKNKFDPDWRPNYLAYDGDLADLAVIALNIEKTMEL